jgi:V8-like Glu-specific endopeptidase
MKVLIKSTIITVVLLAGAFSQAEETEKIIGTNDLVLVNAQASNIPVKYRQLVGAFGLINMGCTATHIGGGYVLTAGHCFGAGEQVERNQPCSDTTIEWGVRTGKSSSDLQSRCQVIVAAQQSSQGVDFALIKVSPIPRTSVQIDFTRRAEAGRELTIFSHPNMEPLQWSRTCRVERSLGSSGVQLPPLALLHTCDSNPGSSGATILSTLTSKVVAIHDGGALSAPGVGMNYGTYLTSFEVARALRSVGFR